MIFFLIGFIVATSICYIFYMRKLSSLGFRTNDVEDIYNDTSFKDPNRVKLANQNIRYAHELRRLNKAHRRLKKGIKSLVKERDILKDHIGHPKAIEIIKTLYPDGNMKWGTDDTV